MIEWESCISGQNIIDPADIQNRAAIKLDERLTH